MKGRRRALDAKMDLALKNPSKRRTRKGEVVSLQSSPIHLGFSSMTLLRMDSILKHLTGPGLFC